MSRMIYETQVVQIGKGAQELLDKNGLLVLFGIEAPDILKDICFIHNRNTVNGIIEEGDILQIEDNIYKILKVGDMACQNLTDIGHCTLNFSGLTEEELLSGSIYLQGHSPAVKVGTIIKILKK